MEVKPRQAHVPGLFGDVQSTQDHAESSGVLGLDAGGRSTEEEALQALVPEPWDRHRRIVTRNVSGCDRLTVGCSAPRCAGPLRASVSGLCLAHIHRHTNIWSAHAFHASLES